MSNQHTDHETSPNGNFPPARRELRNSHITGMLPPPGSPFPGTGMEHISSTASGTGSDFEYMVQSLHDLFEHDRQIASQPDATRCGICYLHFPLSELHYRDEGFYICPGCAHILGNHPLPMLRKQQKL